MDSTDQKIRTHVFTCVLALMLLSLQRRELAMKGIDLSNRRMLDVLGSIRKPVLTETVAKICKTNSVYSG